MSAENPTDITATPPAQGPTEVTAAPASASPALTLPDGPAAAPRPVVAPERLLRRLARLDLFLLGLLLLLAFGTASFPARNTDLLLHMATGRALLQGDYTFGTDPFAHNTAGVYWVNHGWLADLGAYAVWSVAGIPGLIVLKALLVAATALVMVRLGQTSRLMWVSVLCTTPAILLLNTRTLLQSVCISYLFLALTLYFLQRGGGWLNGGEPAPTTRVTWRRYWPLLPLFVLWVNLDEWFFLGPLTVALYLVGQWLQGWQDARHVTPRTPRPGEVESLAVVLVLGLVACCVNPHHVRVFTEWPIVLGLSPATTAMRSDPLMRTLFYSSLHERYLGGNLSTAAHWCVVPLAVLGVLSFVVHWRQPPWSRVPLFVFVLGLALYNARTVGFFAVVGAPLMALNFQELADRRALPSAGRLRRLANLRILSAVGMVLLLAVAYPGWLYQRPQQPGAAPPERRRLAWTDEIDPSLKRTAEFLKELRAGGKLKAESLGANLSPDVANVLAWYCPEEKGFFDSRYGLFGQVKQDRVTALRAIADTRRTLYNPPDRFDGLEDWSRDLREWGVDHVIVYEYDGERMWQPMVHIVNLTPDWVPIYLDGRTAIFGYKKGKSAFAELTYNPERWAYRPAPEERAPSGGPPRLGAPHPFWVDYYAPAPPRPLESDEASLQLFFFEAYGTGISNQNREKWRVALEASVVGAAASPGGPVSPLLKPLHFRVAIQELMARMRRGDRTPPTFWERLADEDMGAFLRECDQAPPAHLILAARAARRALAQSPDDAQAYAHLGKAYSLGLQYTRERLWSERLQWLDPPKVFATGWQRPLQQLRRVQAIAALATAAQLKPDMVDVHGHLAELYSRLGVPDRQGGLRRGYKDLELQHRRAQLRLAQLKGPLPGEDDPTPRLKRLEEYVKGLEREVTDATNRFENKKHRLTKVFDRALEAYDMNLAGKALQILMESDAKEFGAPGIKLQFELALHSGQVRQVARWFEDDDEGELKKVLGDFSYHWTRALLAAATGDYDAADKELTAVAGLSERSETLENLIHLQAGRIETRRKKEPLDVRQVMSLMIGREFLNRTLPPIPGAFFNLRDVMRDCFALVEEESQVHVLRGLLALECGDTDRAKSAFRRALTLLDVVSRKENEVGWRPTVRVIAGEALEKLEAQK